MQKDVSRFLNEEGQVVTWPKKHADKKLVMEYIVEKFELEKPYTEKEVNEIINQWHTFQDWPLLRRGMIDAGLMTRDIEGHEYLRQPM
ncbi:MAG: transcriptional regulator [Candidatus Saccharibacteria bacterium]|nr:transcriptional regulator [Candidatus Saccharibacteria bacterium]